MKLGQKALYNLSSVCLGHRANDSKEGHLESDRPTREECIAMHREIQSSIILKHVESREVHHKNV